MDTTTLELQNLTVRYNGRVAVNNASLDISRQCITALIGASGSGKSSLLRSLNRLVELVPEASVSGEVRFDGQPILSDETDVIDLRRRIGMVFQNPTPFPKSVYDNVAYGLEIQGVKRASGFWSPVRSGEDVQRSRQPLDQAVVRSLQEAALWDEVRDRLFQSAFRLSGGQQQRLCIARAIAVRPEVILLDEPCSQLDPISTKKIEDLLLKLKKKYTVVIVTHNLQQARRISDHVAFMHLGQLVESGPTDQLFSRPQHTTTRDYVSGNFG